MSGPVALGAYLILLALIIVFHQGARRHLIFTLVFKAIPFRYGFSIAP